MTRRSTAIIATLHAMVGGLVATAATSSLAYEARDALTATLHRPLIVESIDFAFDGGSLSFSIRTADQHGLRLLLVHPQSLARERLGKQADCLLATAGDHSLEDAAVLTPDLVRRLVPALAQGDATDKNLQQGCAGLLMLRANRQTLTTWGPEAVEAVKQGDWLRLVSQNATREKPSNAGDDPFADL